MLRVGLTGGLGSGKSTAAAIFASLGAHIFSADAIGRQLMQPGEAVYNQILSAFTSDHPAPHSPLLLPDRQLDRSALARIVFSDPHALHRLNRIVHPAVIAEQQRQMNALFAEDPTAIAIVESALIFEVEREQTAPDWPRQFDKIILVTSPDALKVDRYLARAAQARAAQARAAEVRAAHSLSPHRPILSPEEAAALAADARRRIAAQIPDAEKIPRSDFVISNTGTLADLELQIRRIYRMLTHRELKAEWDNR
jgi:dephospho-CoA kinase